MAAVIGLLVMQFRSLADASRHLFHNKVHVTHHRPSDVRPLVLPPNGPAMPSNFSKVDEYGFLRPEDFDAAGYEKFMATYVRTLTRRAIRWSRILNVDRPRNSSTLKRFIRKGIPAQHRGRVWMLTSGAGLLQSQQPGLYAQLLVEPGAGDPWDEIIKNDLNRTYPDNIHFAQSRDGHLGALYNVLRASARHNAAIGYCQGLNYVAGLLLLATKDEEQSFWLLTVLIRNILPNYHTRTMDGLITDTTVLAELIRIKSPQVFYLMESLHLPWPVIVTKWFICIYAEVLPVETVLRIWDCLFNEGSKMLFRVAVTLIKLNEARLLECADFGDMAECFKTILKDQTVLECHQFMAATFKIPGPLSSNQIDGLRARFRSAVPSVQP